MENHLYSLYQMVLKSLTFYLGVDQERKKAGRPHPIPQTLPFSHWLNP